MHMQTKVTGIIIASALLAILIFMSTSAQASVTMDVDKWNGPSGTYLCKDVYACYMLYYAADDRGDTYYCNSVTIKRDGHIVWYKNFYNK